METDLPNCNKYMCPGKCICPPGLILASCWRRHCNECHPWEERHSENFKDDIGCFNSVINRAEAANPPATDIELTAGAIRQLLVRPRFLNIPYHRTHNPFLLRLNDSEASQSRGGLSARQNDVDGQMEQDCDTGEDKDGRSTIKKPRRSFEGGKIISFKPGERGVHAVVKWNTKRKTEIDLMPQNFAGRHVFVYANRAKRQNTRAKRGPRAATTSSNLTTTGQVSVRSIPNKHDRIQIRNPRQRHNTHNPNPNRNQTRSTSRLLNTAKVATTAAILYSITNLPTAAAAAAATENTVVRSVSASVSIISHLAAGTSLVTSCSLLPLRNNGDLIQPSQDWIPIVYTAWSISFVTLLTCELLHRQPRQRKLLLGTMLITSLYLLGTLIQSAPSTMEGILCWGPMALSASLFAVPVMMDSTGMGSVDNKSGNNINKSGDGKSGEDKTGDLFFEVSGDMTTYLEASASEK